MFAAEIRKKRVDYMRGHRHWKWHLDEIYVKMAARALSELLFVKGCSVGIKATARP
jgi:hypothetical protein